VTRTCTRDANALTCDLSYLWLPNQQSRDELPSYELRLAY